jgi:Sulfotransferase family
MKTPTTSQDAPFQSRRDGVIPFGFFTSFLDFLVRNKDLIEVISYGDLDFGDDWDFESNYPREHENWKASLKDGRRDADKIYLTLQHDVDSHPERSINAVREERARSIRSNVMVFNRHINRQLLGRKGVVAYREYALDFKYLAEAEAEGFVIGYHSNALEQANFDRQQALEIFSSDVQYLSTLFDLKFFSPHGGVRGENGESNTSLLPPESLRRRLRWVNNRHTVRFDGNYSDGGLNGKRPIEDRDPREFIRTWQRGKRYRILFHPQYFHTPYSDTKRLIEAEWYRQLLRMYGRSCNPEEVWSDDLLAHARATATNNRRFLSWIGRRSQNVAAPAIARTKRINPIIVGGDGRSGTTLLSVVLDSHPNLSVGSELHFNGKRLPNLGPYMEECLHAFRKGVRANAADEQLRPGIRFILRCERSGIPPEKLAEGIRAARSATNSDLERFEDRCDLVRRLGEHNCTQNNAERWGFKIMREIRNLTRYGEVWPDACFIHIIRDGRDVAASQLKEHGSWGYGSIEKAAEGWVSVIEGARKSAEGLKYREIKYENLAECPEQTLSRLIAWSGEDWDDALLEHYQAKHALFESKVRHPSRDQVAKPINTSAVGRFECDLTKEQISAFEGIAGHVLEDLHYELRGE